MDTLLPAEIVAVPAVLGVIVTVHGDDDPTGGVSVEPDSEPPAPFASVAVTPDTVSVIAQARHWPPIGEIVSVSATPVAPDVALWVMV
jgi:hypothetical protein